MGLAVRGWKSFCMLGVLLIATFSFLPQFTLAEDNSTKKYTNEELLSRMLVVNAAERSLDSLPALSVTFSQDLSPTENFDKFMTVTHQGKLVTGGWIMARDPRRLYFTNIQPNASYRVQVRPGVKSQSGLVLQEPGDFTVKTRNIKPAFDFASRGSILPARLNNGLPIRIVNVPELDIEFLRVRPEQLKAVLGRLSLDGSIRDWQLDNIHGISDSVYSQRYVTQTRKNARENRVLPIESIPALQEPGLYFAIMREPGRFGNKAHRITHFMVTNIGLHVRHYTDSMEVFVHALDSGDALTGVQLQLQGQKEILNEQSDENGSATFNSLPKGTLLLKASQGEQFAFLDLREQALDLSEYPITGKPDKALAAYIYSPRDLYRPGEAVDLSILLRNRDGQVEPLKKLHLQIIRPDAKVLQETLLTTQYADLGYFSHRIQVPADVPTGTWRAEVRLGQQDNTALQSFSFYVEDFIPERMALDLKSTPEPLKSGEKLLVQVQGDYLYGAPAAGNQLTSSRTLSLNRSPLKQLKDYVFGNPQDEKYLKRSELPALTLDDKGHATLESDALADTIKSPVTVRIIANLKETGGRAVTRTLDKTFWPAQQLPGIRPLFPDSRVDSDSEARFAVVYTNPAAELLAKEVLTVTLIKEDYESYWEYHEHSGWQRAEIRSEYPLRQEAIKLTAGQETSLGFTVAYGRYRLEVEDPESGLKTVYPFSAGWTDGRTLAKRPDQIEMELDKVAYKAGEIAKVTMIPPEDGEAVVAVEGDGILWRRNISLKKAGSHIEIPISPQWKRHDLYISVVSFRPADNSTKISPTRSLGIIHLPLDRSDRALDLQISAPDKVLPEKPVAITVSSEKLRDKTAILTLAAVDVGVLNMTNFKTPDPFAFYFSQREYVTSIHDLYGKIIETTEGQALQQRFGGGAARRGGSLARAEVQIVSLFNAATRFDKDGRAQVEFILPGFDGKLRLMAVAIGEEHLGSAAKEMQVASPVVASLAGPRFLTTGDQSAITLELNNTTEQEQTIHVTLNSNDLLKIEPLDKNFHLAAGSKQVVRLPLKTEQYFGVGSLNLKLTGKTRQENFIANRSLNIALRPAYPSRYNSYHYELPAKGEATLARKLVEPFLDSGLQARLTLSSAPTLPVSSSIQGLIQYPYGCLEQTVSRAYPYIFLEAADTERWGLPALTQKERNERIQHALIRLNGMQLGSGAFTLWSNYGPPEQWLTAYVTNFLLDAKQQGFTVPARMLERALKYLEQYLQQGYNRRYSTPFVQNPAQARFAARTFAAYVLAREKRAVLGSLRVMYEKEVKHAVTGLSLAQLGLALSLQGDKKRGNELINQGLQTSRSPDLYLSDYGSVLRDQSMLLSLLLTHKHSIPELSKRVLRLSRSLQKRHYLSTQEKVFVFLLGQELVKQSDKPWQAQLNLENINLDLHKEGAYTQRLRSQNFANDIKIISQSEQPLYASLVLDGYPKQAPAAVEDYLSIQRDWFSLSDGSPVEPAKIKAGNLLLTRLQIKSKENIRSALVVDLLPAGFELENTNLANNGDLQGVKLQGMERPVLQLIAEQQLDYQEFRDDRYLASLNLRKSGVYQLFYLVRVIAKGNVTVPPPYVEDMYRPDIHGIGVSIGTLNIQ